MNIHHLQSWPDSCIAAAMCMIQRWRGQLPTEAQFHRANAWLRPHYIETLPRVEAHYVDQEVEHELRLHLRYGRVVVATALVQNYESWRSSTYPNLHSPHGMMSSLSSLYHMVVLIPDERDRAGYRLFDPFYTADGQPLEVSVGDFTSWFTGLAFIASS
jgi:hypothetical protein